MMADPRKMARERARREVKRMRASTLTAVRHEGCVCAPAIDVRRLAHGLFHVTAAHDSWCPLWRVLAERGPRVEDRRQVVLVMPKDEEQAA